MTKTRKHAIGIGTKFHYAFADSEPIWEVVKELRRGVYECRVPDSEEDWAGTVRVYAREEIVKALDHEAWQRASDERNDAFYDSLEVGRVVHYHNAFGQFYRCEVVVAPRDTHATADVGPGCKCLRKIALVGTWRDDDLGPDAYPRSTLGRLFRPHSLNIYENPGASLEHKWADPATLRPLADLGE